MYCSMLTGMMTNFGDSGMVQKLQECRVTIATSCTLTVMDISITNKSTGFSFRIQWESTFQKQFSSWTSFRDASCSIYKMTTIFLLYVFQILCVLSNNTWRSELLYIQDTPLSLQWMKNFSLDCKAAILSRRKAINKHIHCECKSLMVLLCCGCWTLEQTEYVNTVLTYLSSIGCAY